jgi:SAM-dependent methyltransferase
MPLEEEVATHYTGTDRARAIVDALRAEGLDPDRLSVDDLAPVDEFHIRGRQATVELGAALGLGADQHVLDVGSGIGGASRYFAQVYGARVTGIDLTPEYCRLAARFARSTGLADRLEYRQCSALAMPFEDATFDAAYTQHVAMNIADKPALYAEIARVLKPGAVGSRAGGTRPPPGGRSSRRCSPGSPRAGRRRSASICCCRTSARAPRTCCGASRRAGLRWSRSSAARRERQPSSRLGGGAPWARWPA